MTREEWLERIRAASGLPAGEGEELNRFDRIIEAVALDEARRIAMEASPGELTPKPISGSISWRLCGSRWIGSLPLPQDWLRICCLRLHGWKKSVREVSMSGDEEYWRRWSAFGELAGSTDAPRIYLAEGADMPSLEIHCGSSPDDTVAEGLYISRPAWEDGLLPEYLAPALILRASATVRAMIG